MRGWIGIALITLAISACFYGCEREEQKTVRELVLNGYEQVPIDEPGYHGVLWRKRK